MKVKKQTLLGREISLEDTDEKTDIVEILKKNRNITGENEQVFFAPTLRDLFDPFLIPDMQQAVDRIKQARETNERIVIFGDYDVDGVSSTALLVRFFAQEFACNISYRLPHRVNDGYGLKSYFFDDLAEKSVKLVITVDCWTRDIEPIRYAKSLGIDVIVTDHHAVPENIPEEVVGILNPKRSDSEYPFPSLSWSGVAFKLIHAVLINTLGSDTEKIEKILEKYIDFAALGTVSDCMPLISENRIITKLWLRQMKQSISSGLRQFTENTEEEVEDNAEFIGFRVGPRINASGRMDTPMTALRWLLAGDARANDFLEQIEVLNTKRQTVVKDFTEKALAETDTNSPILYYTDSSLEHGLIGLVAGKLTETYNRPSVVLCPSHDHGGETKKREYENLTGKNSENFYNYVASCRAPEWCDIMELLDRCHNLFVRYGGHKQAAGFTISKENLPILQKKLALFFHEKYGTDELPRRTIRIEGSINPEDLTIDTIAQVDQFRPFWIGNPKPLWMLHDVTVLSTKKIGKDQNHLTFFITETPHIKFLFWNGALHEKLLAPGNVLSLIVRLEKNEWNNQITTQCVVEDIIL